MFQQKNMREITIKCEDEADTNLKLKENSLHLFYLQRYYPNAVGLRYDLNGKKYRLIVKEYKFELEKDVNVYEAICKPGIY